MSKKSIFGLAEEANRWATERQDDGGAAAKEKARLEAIARQDFTQTMFGKTKERMEWGKKQEVWAQHCAAIDKDPLNFNIHRVSFPNSIWAVDPITGGSRQPGPIDLSELRLEDISVEAYQAIHGPVVPSGLPAGTDISGILDVEKAKEILERYGLAWDVQDAKVRKLRAEIEKQIIQALDPWKKWHNGTIDYSIVSMIENATMPTQASAGTVAIFGNAKPTGGALGAGIDDLLARAIQFDNGEGSDRSLAYAMAVMFRNNPSFLPRLFLLGKQLQDENIQALYTFQVLYGSLARDRRQFARLSPAPVPDFIRYGTQEQLERNLQEQLDKN